MVNLNLESVDVFAAVYPIRYSITYTQNKKIFAFASLNDVCFAKSDCLGNPSNTNIIKTLPLKKPAACLSFVKSENQIDKDTLLLIDSDGVLHVYEVIFNDDNVLKLNEIETGKKTYLPSDFCHGQYLQKDRVYFWCRRNVLFCKKNCESESQQFVLKADIKCFDSVVYENLIFCVVGCVNGNVYFLDVDVTDLTYKFKLVGLVNLFPIPVTNCAIKKIDKVIVAAFNHGHKVTTVKWEESNIFSTEIVSSMKIKRQLEMGGKNWFLSTDSVIGDFTTDIASLYFTDSGKRLLIITNERDFGVYDYKKDSEGQYNWINIALGGEAAQRSFGYCGGVLSPDENKVIIYNTKGALIPFILEEKSEDFYIPIESSPPFNGHLSLVTGAHWDLTGKMLFTSGSRSREIHLIGKLKDDGSLCQIARPESHQYDIQAFSVISGLRMIVGSDELPFRVYQASSNYVKSVENIIGLTPNELKKNEIELPTTPFFKQPVLGVLNVAAGDADNDEDVGQVGEIFTNRPTINSLMRFTYWEVIESLYGHTNPAAALAIDPNAELLATSCHATSPEDAIIIMRRMSDWNIIDKLPAHNLTVTKLEFSPNGEYLLSVSRDRSFAVFGKEKEKWKLINRTPDAHSRMIFASAWSPDSKIFFTASRDGQLCSWLLSENPKLLNSTKMTSAVYSLALTSIDNERMLLVAGLGDGRVQFFSLKDDGVFESVKFNSVEDSMFSLPVTCLEFRKQKGPWREEKEKKYSGNEVVLAAGSENGIVKVFTLLC